MQFERLLDLDEAAAVPMAVPKPAPGGPVALFRRRSRSAEPIIALPLAQSERRHYEDDAFIRDGAGYECFRGLDRAESLDYIELQRIGLDNDDASFLRLIRLGDRHASAMRVVEPR